MGINEAIKNGIIKQAEPKKLIGLHPGITGKISMFLVGDCTGLVGQIPIVGQL